jgi:hypothetical protein
MACEPHVSPLCPRVWRAIHGVSKVKSGMVWVDERHGPRLKRITEPLVRLSTRPIGPVGISKIPERMVKVDIVVSATVRIQPERIRLADLHLRATWVQRDAVARGERCVPGPPMDADSRRMPSNQQISSYANRKTLLTLLPESTASRRCWTCS